MDLRPCKGFIPAPCFLCHSRGVLLGLGASVFYFQSGFSMLNSREIDGMMRLPAES